MRKTPSKNQENSPKKLINTVQWKSKVKSRAVNYPEKYLVPQNVHIYYKVRVLLKIHRVR